MLELYSYTDKEMDQLLNSMVYLVDTREHENKNTHITDMWDKMGLNYKKKKLDYGDYSFMIPANQELGIIRDLYFQKKIVIERKNSLDELAGNLKTDRERLKREFTLAPDEKVLLIESATYSDLLHGNYRSEYSAKSFWASVHSFWHEFGIPVVFMPNPNESAYFIKGYFQYWLRNFLK